MNMRTSTATLLALVILLGSAPALADAPAGYYDSADL